jgi:uncharacterized membrane protein
MRSKFAIAGHPIHPALVAVPIGLFIWAFVADFIYLFTGKDELWYDISYWTGLAAIIAALVAALPGFGDYFTVVKGSDASSTATTHMLLNLATVAVFAIAFALMIDDNARDGGMLTLVIVLHGFGVGMLSLAGYLGGEMVFRHHIGMEPDTTELEAGEQARHRRGVQLGGERR